MAITKDLVDLVDSLGVKDLIQLGTSLTQRGVEAGSKAYTRISEERRTLVEIPEVYSSDYRLKVEDAKRWLEEDGLKVEVVIAQPNIAFKDCLDSEVVATNYKLKRKVKPGTRIILRYVNTEIIETSKKLFLEHEKQKEEQDLKNKQKIDKAIENVQQGFNSVVSSTQKGVKNLFKFNK